MSRSIKWILAIVIGLVLVAAIAVVGFFVVSRLSHTAIALGPRPFPFWEGRRPLPMQPFRGMPFGRFGGFSLLRFFGGWLIFPGLLAWMVVGVIALLFALARSGQKPAAPLPASTPTAAPVPVSTGAAGKNCPNCGRPVQDDWSHCPYCGTALPPS